MPTGLITIVPYNPQWPHDFIVLATPLQQTLDDLALRIDHIGSTAVPGLAAKDVIDIQVTVRAFTPALEAALATLGYVRRTDVTADHRPPLAHGPDQEWEKWYFRPPVGQPPTHLHVRIDGRANQRYALLFRDYLRVHPVAAQAYSLVKQHLAQHAPTDWDAYYAIKDPVCDIIWSAAEEWARATRWTPTLSNY
jgi:GrpB-like predicted nucleotidyltransferase (UPF0157 family)